MPRTREFDIDEVTEKAMQVFWRQGYAATAMSDVYAATGLKAGNLYGAFKDKDALFRHCFAAYAKRFRATLPQDLKGRPAIAAWIAIQCDLATQDPDKKGCLIINTVAERELHSPETRALAAGRLSEIRDFFMQNLSYAAARGEISGTPDIVPAADALLGTVVSIMTLGRAAVDPAVIEHVAQMAVDRLVPSFDK
ncbi:TetR/AcrR family transcriptional regulator [uncultured Devosia sp.]|uniref:TetR/AcrR family transcriptional regulator n=1 Tax=uncultured Devosia sp. TaxID=211434 RepID=UPI0035CA51CF